MSLLRRVSSGLRRASLLLLALAAAGLACEFPLAPDPGAMATAVAGTLTAGAPTSPASPSPTASPAAQNGTLAGQICYPSEGIPAMTAYFEDVVSHAVVSLAIAANQSGYTVDLTPGTYYAYAWVGEFAIGGSYSQAVPCGLTVACGDHSLIPVNVIAGQTTSGVDICDWYGGPGSVPTPPPPPGPAAIAPPPPGGVSLNCDATYQRVRLTDAGPAGRTLWVDSWDGSTWVNVWSVAGGDPNIRQIEEEAGAYQFLGCQNLVILPIRYSGSGAYLELMIYRWNGAGLSEVYHHEGTHGVWDKAGDTVEFEESLYLFNEPNCCPCNRQTLQHTWNGAAFLETASSITPTYSGTPPAECSGG